MAGIVPRIRIASNDPLARGILEQFYDLCKERMSVSTLSHIEQQFLQTIETAYSENRALETEEVALLFKQVYEVLDETPQQSVRQEELMNILQSAVVPSASRVHSFNQFFHDIKKTVLAAKQSDFSKLLPIYETEGDRHNLLSFVSVSINSILETVRQQTFGRYVIETLFQEIPQAAMIVATSQGEITELNEYATTLIGIDHSRVRKENVASFIPFWETLMEQNDLDEGKKQLDCTLNLNGAPKRINLLVIPIQNAPTEVEEFLVLLLTKPPFNLRLDNTLLIANIQMLLQQVTSLTKKLGKNEELEVMEKSIWDVRELIQGSLEEFLQKAPQNLEPIRFDQLLTPHFEKIKKNHPDVEVRFHNLSKGDFFANPEHMHQLFSWLFDIVGLYEDSEYIPNSIYLEIKEAGSLGILITLDLVGFSFDLNENEVIYFIETKEYRAMEQLVKRYTGFIEVQPCQLDEGLIQICLPYQHCN